MITLQRLNVVKLVDSEAKARALEAKGFVRALKPAVKADQKAKKKDDSGGGN